MTNPVYLRRLAGLCSLTLGVLSLGTAEALAQQKDKKNQPADKEVLTLSPFEVNVSKDTGYGALQSSSLTNFSMDLHKMPATAQVFTQAFIDDTASTSIEGMLVNYAGTVGYNPNNAAAALDMTGDRNGSQGLGIRGLQASGIKRDGFIGMKNSARTATGNTDNFDIERVELIEGPQSILYGAVGGGGVVNTVSKRAAFRERKGSVQYTFDDNSDRRATFDYNYGLEKVAVRVAGVRGDGATERFNLSNQHDLDGLYVQVAYRPIQRVTVRVLGERINNLAVFNNEPNFDSFLPVGDPRRGVDRRYLALTGQLANVTNVLKNEPLTYENYSSLSGWWTSEKISNRYLNAVVEMELGAGFSAKVTGMYSETLDQRSNAVNSKTLLLPNAGGNPFNEAAYSLTNAGFNEQQDRTKGVQFTLLHQRDFKFWRLEGRSNTAFGVEFSHQGPSFGSSGYDTKYYQADANWNPVINSALTQDYGRIPMPAQYWAIGSGIQTKPLFDPYAGRVTLNGVNYVAQHRILYDPARITTSNPFGIIPNAPTAANPNAFSGNWNPGGDTNNRLLYLANVTDWFDGKLTTVAGASVNTFDTVNFGPTSTGVQFTILPKRDYWGYMVGGNIEVPRVPGLRFYATLSTAGLSAGTTVDYYGQPLKVPEAKSPQPEIGFKWISPEQRFIAALSYNPTTEVKNETQNAGTDPFNAVNPDGINGRFNSGNQWINLDRKASAAGLVITATPTRNWTMRFSATKLDGEVTSTVKYAQLYNDQFYVNGGTVTYKDGTAVMVNATNTTGGPKDTPLTLAMINNPASPFYANPDPNSGSIRSGSVLRTVLTTVDPVHGTAATGVTGLPISSIQYNYSNPNNGVITVVAAGDRNTGINEYSFNFQNSYSFNEGPLKGLSVFFDVQRTIDNRAYYTITFPAGSTNTLQGVRSLYQMPDLTVCGLGLSYTHPLPGRFDRLSWSTRLNIKNLFDQSDVIVMPNVTNSAQLRARLDAQPRLFIWSNTISF
ncbi:MAG TPA: TonB-dependent receptor plug domain-containing protein [Lacunisphaera sp.]|nr:TonB-dependent receptor plug domain-containing protein [Lacunisphaera sp.]